MRRGTAALVTGTCKEPTTYTRGVNCESVEGIPEYALWLQGEQKEEKRRRNHTSPATSACLV